MKNISKLQVATRSKLAKSGSPYSWPIKLVLLLYIGSMYSGMASAASEPTGGTSANTELDTLSTDHNTEELVPEFDCLTEECPQEVVHQLETRALDRSALPPSINQLVYNLLRELDNNNAFFAGVHHSGGHSIRSIPLPIARLLLQRLRDPSAGIANETPVVITPIRKQRGNQLKMANRFGKRDRLRMSNRFGRK